MPTGIDQLIQHLDKSHARLRDAVDAVPGSSREDTPAEGGWSVAQVVEHLAHTDRVFTQMLGKFVAELRGQPADHVEVYGLLQRRKLLAVLDRNTKVESKEWILPVQNWDSAHALEMLEAARAVLIQVIRSAEGVPLSNVSYPHFILGELNLYEWIAFLGYHEARHAAQIQDVARSLGCTPAI
jgi:uncharacterized damage-inducible protein DinB